MSDDPTPYGPCGHTKYAGSPPCIHDAYLRGREDAAAAVREAQALEMVDPWMDGYKCGRNDAKKSFMRLIRNAYRRGREDAAKDAERVLGAKHNELVDVISKHGYNCDCQIGGADAMSIDTDWLRKFAADLFTAVAAARGGEQEQLDHYSDCNRALGCTCGTRIIDNPQQEQGAQPHRIDTNLHPDSQRFRYGNGNNFSTVGNTILDDSDDEKVVAGNYVDNVTDAGDTPQPATNWVRSLLQPGDVDSPNTEQSEPINGVVRTVSPASTLQNRQAADADV